jgi:hypothetical protein
LVLATALAATAQTAGAARVSGSTDVVVPAGQPVQIAFTADTVADPGIAAFSISFRNAIGMAVALHPRIHGFRIRINATETGCSSDNTASAARRPGLLGLQPHDRGRRERLSSVVCGDQGATE